MGNAAVVEKEGGMQKRFGKSGYKRSRPPAGNGWCTVPDDDPGRGVGRAVLLRCQSSRRAVR